MARYSSRPPHWISAGGWRSDRIPEDVGRSTQQQPRPFDRARKYPLSRHVGAEIPPAIKRRVADQHGRQIERIDRGE